MNSLETILDRVPETDRPAMQALLEFGIRPDKRIVAKCRRGAYKKAVDDAMAAITAAKCQHKFA